MLLDVASDKPSLSLLDIDRYSIPDPWDDTRIEFEEKPAIVTLQSTALIPETRVPRLAPAPEVNAATVLVQDELKLDRKADLSVFIKIQDLLAQLYWADSICEE